MAQLKSSVRRVTIHLPSDDLQTTVVRGVGYRVTYSDGTKGPKRRTYREARQDARDHKQANAAPVEREDVTPAREREGC